MSECGSNCAHDWGCIFLNTPDGTLGARFCKQCVAAEISGCPCKNPDCRFKPGIWIPERPTIILYQMKIYVEFYSKTQDLNALVKGNIEIAVLNLVLPPKICAEVLSQIGYQPFDQKAADAISRTLIDSAFEKGQE